MFENNEGSEVGGALSFECQSSLFCTSTLINVTFEKNKAINRGGAIYYDLYRPTMENITYIDNEAEYGPNIASYPVKISPTTPGEEILEGIVSGQTVPQTLTFSLMDHDDQIAVDIDGGSISIS